MEKRNLTTAAKAAKSIKSELKHFFPDVKFSVKSDNYAGGNAVRISWDNGVTLDAVEQISNKYEYGTFDGMTDMYNYDNKIKGLDQIKYVTTSRTITTDKYMEAYKLLKDRYAVLDGTESLEAPIEAGNCCGTVRNFIYRKICKLDLRKELTLERLEKERV